MIVIEVRPHEVLEIEHSLRVGRDAAWASLVLDDDQVSRHHLEIRPYSEGYRVWDVGSRNGTTVDGKRVGVSGRALREGDVIQLGSGARLKVRAVTAPPRQQLTTVAGPKARSLQVRLKGDQFTVEYRTEETAIRDTIPYQLGLALSMLVLIQRDGFGPVADADMRAIVWRGDQEQQERGDINRLIHRVRDWFRSRDVEPPPIDRPKSAFASRLTMPPSSVSIQPDGWLYRFLDED